MWLAMTTEKNTKPGEGTPPLSVPSHGRGNTADEAQAGGSIASNIGDSLPTGTQGGDNNKISRGASLPTGTQGDSLPTGTQGGNISEADLGVSLPTGTLEGKDSLPKSGSASGEEPTGTIGGSFKGTSQGSQGTSLNAGAALAAPAFTQHDPSDVSESSSSLRTSRGKRSSSAGRERKGRVQPTGTIEAGMGRKGGTNIRKGRGVDVEADQNRNWFAQSQDAEQETAVSLAAQGGGGALPVTEANNTEAVEGSMLIGGIEENTFKAIATAVGRHLAQQKEGDINQLPEGAQMREAVEGVVGLSPENKQKFADICVNSPAWHKTALTQMGKEIEKQNNAFLMQDGKRIKYGEGAREGLNKGISPSREHNQVSVDKSTAEATGYTTCGSIRDLLSTADTGGEITSYNWLEGACQIDEIVRLKVGDAHYVGPAGLGWTMYELFEQICAVKQLYESDGRLLQPPNILLKEQAACGVLAKAEQWWVTQLAQIMSMPEHPEGGFIDGNTRVDAVYIKITRQEAYLEEQRQKNTKKTSFASTRENHTETTA